MTDLEKWKQWLDSWGVEYEINVYDFNDDIAEIHINVEGCYCWAEIVFNKNTEKFIYMGATE